MTRHHPRSTALRLTLLASLVALLLAAPTALAQDDVPPGALSVTATTDGMIDPAGTDLPVNVTVDCSVMVGGLPSPKVVLSLDAAPAWLNATDEEITIDPTSCAGKASITVSGTVALAPADDAPGLEEAEVRVKATLGSRTATETMDMMVEYKPGYTIDPDGDQTFDVTNATLTFPFTITLTSNAQTMVMFEDLSVQQGSISGLNADTYPVLDGDLGETRTITFRAPDTAWTQANVTFYTYAHCRVDGVDVSCPPTDERNITWTFVNKMAPMDDGAGPSDPEESPLVSPLAIILVGLAVVALARRR